MFNAIELRLRNAKKRFQSKFNKENTNYKGEMCNERMEIYI